MHILVTGASGFVGSEVLSALIKKGYKVTATYHSEIHKNDLKSQFKVKFDLNSKNNDYDDLFKGVDIVIHLAAKVHFLNNDDHDEYNRINYIGTKLLVEEASKRNVKKFIFLSTIKVNGEKNMLDFSGSIKPFCEDGPVFPEGAYALSKFKAEQAIKKVCSNSKMDYVILRPVLIYGPGVKANFLTLISIVNKKIPLPLLSINNKRSLIYVKNLSSAILCCVDYKKELNKVYMISDVSVSTPMLHREIANSMNVNSYLFHFPISFLKLLGLFLGVKDRVARLTESLCVDNSKFKEDLNWEPPYSFSEGLKNTVNWYMKTDS